MSQRKVVELRDFLYTSNHDITQTLQKYEIVDILHTDTCRLAGQSKQGAKYDERRGRTIYVDTSTLQVGCGVSLIVLVKDEPCKDESCKVVVYDVGGLKWYCLYTTAYIDITSEGEYVLLHTQNSIYKLKPMHFDDTDTAYLRVMHLN